jgi:EAL domain-containing protein (putative c-di-GMP-specific phosphodiesterase class I)
VTTPWANAACGLDIEITEGALLDDCAAEVKRLTRLRTDGVRIAIDDFGTGYSSLSRLSDLPIDTLKIDRSFIHRLPDDGLGKTLVTTIVSLAHAFGMSVVAEGVETEEQLGALWESDRGRRRDSHAAAVQLHSVRSSECRFALRTIWA